MGAKITFTHDITYRSGQKDDTLGSFKMFYLVLLSCPFTQMLYLTIARSA